MDGILHDINERDRQDMTRAVAPLKQAVECGSAGYEQPDARGEHSGRSAYYS